MSSYNIVLLQQTPRKIFFVIIVIPFLIQCILLNIIKTTTNINFYYFMFFILALFYLPYFYYLNVAVKFLYNNKSVEKNVLKIITFKATLIINIILVFNFVFLAANQFGSVFHEFESKLSSDLMLLLLAFQLIGFLSYLYNTYFIIRLLNIENVRTCFINNLFLKLFFLSYPPIAIWVIQTQIRKIEKN